MHAARLGAAMAGLVFAVAAVALDDPRLGWIAIGLLLVSLLIRLFARRSSTPAP